MELSEETGLPTLPDGFWWRVCEDSYYVQKDGLTQSVDCYYVKIMTKSTEKRHVLVDIKPTFFNTYKSVRLVETNEFEDKSVVVQPILSFLDMTPTNLTKNNIKKAAKKALKKFNEINRETNDRSLIGDYPPKSLNTP